MIKLERNWQEEEQEWKSLVRTEQLNLLKEFQKRDREKIFTTADEVNAETQWRQARREEVNRKLAQIHTQKVQSLRTRLDQLDTEQEIASLQAVPSYKNISDLFGLSQFISDPVNIITGESYIHNVDVTLKGPFPLEIGRNYSSQHLRDSAFGHGWKMSGVPLLIPSPNGSTLYVIETDGLVIVYTQDPRDANRWLPTPEKNPHINHINGGQPDPVITKQVADTEVRYILAGSAGDKRTFKASNLVIRERPYLEKWEDQNGNYYTFQLGTNIRENDYGKLAKIISNTGNQVHFTYDQKGRIVKAVAGEDHLQYQYSEEGDLIEVSCLQTNGDEKVRVTYNYQQAQQTVDNQEKTVSTHRIICEKTEGRVLENSYDAQGRITTQKMTAGEASVPGRNVLFTYENTQEADKTITGSTVVKDAQNNQFHYEYANGLITKITDPLGQTIHQEWYPVGDTSVGAYPRSLKQYIDKRGLVTQFKYDTKGKVVEKSIVGDGVSNTATTKFA